MKQKFKVGDNVIITSWHFAKIKLPQRGVITCVGHSPTPYQISIEIDQRGDKNNRWWFKEGEFILSHFDGDIPEVGTECNVITGRVADGYWDSERDIFEELNYDWDNFNIEGYKIINNKLYAITPFRNGVLASELRVVNKVSESKQLNKTTTMNEFYVSGSDSLKCAFVKECKVNGIEATSGVESDVTYGHPSDSSVIGGDNNYRKVLCYTDTLGKTEFKLPAQYNEALEYAKAFFNQKEEVKEEDPLEELRMDDYEVEFEDGMVKFGCKEFKPSQVNKILSVMKYLEDISDGGHRAVTLTRGKLDVNGDVLDFDTLQKIYNRIK